MAPNPRDESYLLVFTRGSARKAPFAEGPADLLVTLEENALIGATALGEEGFHVVLVKPRSGSPANHVVMIVDDEPSVLKAVSIVLRRSRFEVLEANSGERGLEALRSGFRVIPWIPWPSVV